MRKGQSATEYLMTYGWAILAIAIVGGLLYFMVFAERGCAVQGAQGFSLVQGLAPDNNEFSIDSLGALNIALANHLGKDVTVLSVTNDANTNIDISDINIAEGAIKTLSIPGFGTPTAGKCYSLKFTVFYNTSTTGITLSSSGTLNGRY